MTAQKIEDARVCTEALAQVIDTLRAIVNGDPFAPAVVREGRQRCGDNPYRPPCSPLHMVWSGELVAEEALTALLAEWIALAKIYSRLMDELESGCIAARAANLGEYVFVARRYSSAHGALRDTAEGLLENILHGSPDVEALAECFDAFLGDADFSDLLAGVEQERAALPRRIDSSQSTLDEDPKTKLDEQTMRQIAEAVGDGNAGRILEIAHRTDISGHDKMGLILREDPRYAGKSSEQWGTLLGVSAAAVRGYTMWKTLQERKKADW